METHNKNQFSLDAKDFLESCCKNVEKAVEDIQNKENFRHFSERFFYAQFFDRIQKKIFIYKLNEFKKKSSADDVYLKNSQIDAEKKKIYEISKKDGNNFLLDVIKKVSLEYNDRTVKMFVYVIKIQRAFKAHLKRFIEKMENMNKQIEMEMKRAEERQLAKSIARKKSLIQIDQKN
jgi:hypothetical protein